MGHVGGQYRAASFHTDMLSTAPPCSRTAVALKFTLDQVLGLVLWQAAFLTINPSYRAAARNLLRGRETAVV